MTFLKETERQHAAETMVKPLSADMARECAVLLEMIQYKRPHNSRSERRFIGRFIEPLSPHRDEYGNMVVCVDDAPVIWSCHTDTVHRTKGQQTVLFDGRFITLPANTASDCLGADDTAGIWLMLQMIGAGVPGTYLFHRNEERGRVGSEWLTENKREWLTGIDYAIALDRRGTNSIITHQMCERCCSDDFARSLRDALPTLGLVLDNGGSFTDTASYTDLIGECTNLSVGYEGAHTSKETLDVGFLFRMRDALCAIDIGSLVSKRKPGEPDPDDWMHRFPGSFGRSYGSYGDRGRSVFDDIYDDDNAMRGGGQLETLVARNPAAIADILEQHGYDYDEIRREILEMYGQVYT